MGRSVFLGVTHDATPRGGVPALPNFGGSFLFLTDITNVKSHVPDQTDLQCIWEAQCPGRISVHIYWHRLTYNGRITENLSHHCNRLRGQRVATAGYAAVTTMPTIRRRFDGRSTAYQRSLRSQWRNPLAAVTLTYLSNKPQCSRPVVTWVVEWS